MVAIAAARNGLEAAMCCSVGDDDFGRYLLGTLRENRVRCIRRDPAGRRSPPWRLSL